MEMLVVTYTKEELRNKTYEIPEVRIDEVLPYLSDWISDFIMQHSDDT